jgi:hypothetical protein
MRLERLLLRFGVLLASCLYRRGTRELVSHIEEYSL